MTTEGQAERPSSPERGFERLSRRTQVRRMRGLAEAALAAYDLPPARLTLLAHLFNTTFRVDTATGQRYVLRIHRAGTPTVETVGAELDWLAALRRDTALEVPAPVPTRAGPLLTVAAAPGVPQPHICVLFRWLPGRRLRRGLTPRHLERAGELMARLQNHALQWQPPPGFTRGRVDWPIEAARWAPDLFAPEIVTSIHALVAETLSAAEAAQVTAVLERVRAAEQALGMNKPSALRSPAGAGARPEGITPLGTLWVRGRGSGVACHVRADPRRSALRQSTFRAWHRAGH